MKTSLVLTLLLAMVFNSVDIVRCFTIIDTSGSLDELLAVAALLQPLGSGELLTDKVPLIVVTSTGGGATNPSAALENVINFLLLANSEDVTVARGATSSWRDATNDTMGLKNCIDTLRDFPRSPSDCSASSPFSQFDEETLFGISEQIPQSKRSFLGLPSAGANIIDLMSRTQSWERIDYVAFGALTSLATFLKVNENYAGVNKLNVHIISTRDYRNYQLDPLAAQYVLQFGGLYRKVYFPSLFESLLPISDVNWASFLGLKTASLAPRAVKLLVDAFAAKASLYEKRSGAVFTQSGYGPLAVFGAFLSVDPAAKSTLASYEIDAVSVVQRVPGGPVELNVTALDAAGHHPQESVVFRGRFPNPGSLWNRVLLELRQAKHWMDG